MRIFTPRLTILPLLILAAALLSTGSVHAADLTAARAKVQAMCQVCHGIDGVAIVSEAANLSGQQKAYIVTQLRAYRAGSRQDPQMSIIAKSLTDVDIENLAEWYSGIKVTVEMPK